MIGFAAPGWLFLLPLALAPLALRRWGRAAAAPHPRAREVGGAGRARLLAALPDSLRALVLLLLVLALARPGVAGPPEPGGTAAPVVVALDVSSSMLARDFGGETRLQVARAVLQRFLEQRDGPVGLVAFAAEAVTLVPVTNQQAVLRGALANLRVGLVEDGTAIGEGLAVALNRLRALPGADAGERAIVLLSDGRSNRGAVDPREAARAAELLGVRVYTVGIGSARAVLPAATADSALSVEQQAALDEPLLVAIAERTGGRYFRAGDEQALRRVFAEIGRLVGSPPPEPVIARPWTGVLLLLAGALLLAEWALRASRWGAVP